MTADPTHRHLAQLMAGITRDVLWQRSGRASEGGRLHCRAGRGRATWHRFNPARAQHEIVFGALMVADKSCPRASAHWLSSREIRHRGYWGGTVSMLNLLAHTCCHEFAHLLQTRAGERQYGRVHTPAFYRLLDGLHEAGQADAVRSELKAKANRQGLPLADARYEESAAAKPDLFRPGDRVRFGHAPALKEGRVRRVNRKTCTVEGLGADRGRHYRVPPQLMVAVETA